MNIAKYRRRLILSLQQKSIQPNKDKQNADKNDEDTITDEKIKKMMSQMSGLEMMQLFCYSQEFKIILQDWSRFPQEMKMIELRLIYLIATILLKNQQSLMKLDYLKYCVTLGASDAIHISEKILSRVTTEQGKAQEYKNMKVIMIRMFKEGTLCEKDHIDLYSFTMNLWFDALSYQFDLKFQPLQLPAGKKKKILQKQNHIANGKDKTKTQQQNKISMKGQDDKPISATIQEKVEPVFRDHFYHHPNEHPSPSIGYYPVTRMPDTQKSPLISQQNEKKIVAKKYADNAHKLFQQKLNRKRKTLIELDQIPNKYKNNLEDSFDSNFQIVFVQQEQKKYNLPKENDAIKIPLPTIYKDPLQNQPYIPQILAPGSLANLIEAKKKKILIQNDNHLSYEEKKALDRKWSLQQDFDFCKFYAQSQNDSDCRQKMQRHYGTNRKWISPAQMNIRIRMLAVKVFSKFESLTTQNNAYRQFRRHKILILGEQINNHTRAKRTIFRKLALLFNEIKAMKKDKNRTIARLVVDINFIVRKYYTERFKLSVRR